MEQIKAYYNDVKVIYYTTKTDERGTTRVVKMSATLKMTSAKKGYIFECQGESLDETNLFIYSPTMAENEVGKIKFLSAVYGYKIIT